MTQDQLRRILGILQNTASDGLPIGFAQGRHLTEEQMDAVQLFAEWLIDEVQP